jgi:hypothetical protein
LIYPIGQGSFSDGMPLGISGTFNFMIVFQAEHNLRLQPFDMLGVGGVFGGSRFSAMPGCLVKSSLIRETTENESANEGYRFGQEEETYNIVAAHGYFGRLIFQFVVFQRSISENEICIDSCSLFCCLHMAIKLIISKLGDFHTMPNLKLRPQTSHLPRYLLLRKWLLLLRITSQHP